MKANLDYYKLHEAIKKFRQFPPTLTREEHSLIMQVLKDAECEIYPSEFELEAQEKRIILLNRINYDTYPGKWNKIMAECNKFKSKYY